MIWILAILVWVCCTQKLLNWFEDNTSGEFKGRKRVLFMFLCVFSPLVLCTIPILRIADVAVYGSLNP